MENFPWRGFLEDANECSWQTIKLSFFNDPGLERADRGLRV